MKIIIAHALCFLLLLHSTQGEEPLWGIEGLITRLPQSAESRVLENIENSRVNLIRARTISGINSTKERRDASQQILQKYVNNGQKVLAIASLGKIRSYPSQIESDNIILNTFSQSQQLCRANQEYIDYWELFNEPDVGFTQMLPDRATALMKATYLGIKSAHERKQSGSKFKNNIRPFYTSDLKNGPTIIAPSLALPQGPWANRAARNHLWHYCDGWNFHYYGHIDSFRQTVDNYRTFIQSLHQKQLCHNNSLPMWLSEINRSFSDSRNQSMWVKNAQSKFIKKAISIAYEKNLASFIPFASYHSYQPTLNYFNKNGAPFPAWTTYKTFIEENKPFTYKKNSKSRRTQPPEWVSKVIIHWEPDLATCYPDKVSGSYWFKNDEKTIKGRLRVTNLGSKAVRGSININNTSNLNIRLNQDDTNSFKHSARVQRNSGQITIPPLSDRSFIISLNSIGKKYFREEIKLTFRYTSPMDPWFGFNETPLVFGVSSNPHDPNDLCFKPLSLKIPKNITKNTLLKTDLKPNTISSINKPWYGLNGLIITNFSSGRYPWLIETTNKNRSHRNYACAVSHIQGLPGHGLFRLETNKTWGKKEWIWIYLIDENGQQFCIWENQGRNYNFESKVLFLSTHDMQILFHGTITPDPKFRPEKIREIYIRYENSRGTNQIKFNLKFATTEEFKN